MTHLSAEQLAGHALRQRPELAPGQLDHLAQCEQCRGELDELSAVIRLSSEPVPPTAMPAGSIWRNIRAELASDAAPTVGETFDAHGTAASDNSTSEAPPQSQPAVERSRPPSRARIALLAAGVGLVVGIGATVAVNQARDNQVDVVASTALTPLPGHQGHGTAELVRARDGVVRLDVSLEAPPTPDLREVWLINTDGKRMYSLGSLPPDGTGSFPVPARLAPNLEGFIVVDVSLEPYDGNPAHSGNSEVRGTLPV
jgi:anti-sigma-K factor RskA